jgi:hypothetical protein
MERKRDTDLFYIAVLALTGALILFGAIASGTIGPH